MFQNTSNVHISGGTFQNITYGSTDADIARGLLAQHIAPNALPNSACMYDAPKCYPETRKAINNKLQRWIRRQDDLNTKLIWLHGGAGAGKSAIMRTTALGGPDKQDEEEGNDPSAAHVLGSFFFSRNDPTRNTAEALIPTLAFQLCKAHPAARNAILSTIADNRELIFTTSLQNQVRSLLLKPLSALEEHFGWLSRADPVQDESQLGRVYSIFIIDGLDECTGAKKQREIIDALAFLVRDLPVRVLLASRPDEPIMSAIRDCVILRSIYSEICLTDDPDSDADIQLFLEDSLKAVYAKRTSRFPGSLSHSWPSKRDIDELVWKSSSHFIYASTAVRYIASGEERPDVALRVILGLQAPRTGRTFDELDTLYRHILGKARFRKEILQIISFCLFTSLDPSVANIHLVLGYPREDIHHFLSDVHALVGVSKSETRVYFYLQHKSFQDFLSDKGRAGEFYIGTLCSFHSDKLQRYFSVLDAVLQPSGDHSEELFQLGTVDELVEDIATGIAASPLSDVISTLIQNHPPRQIYSLFGKEIGLSWHEPYIKYMQGIGQYDFYNHRVYRDSLKDFLAIQQQIVVEKTADDRFDDIIIPLLLEGFDIETLRDIHLAGDRFFGINFAVTIGAFHSLTRQDGVRVACPCKHYHPVHLFRQIRQEMTDADDKLANATLKMLKLIIDGRRAFRLAEWTTVPRHLFGSVLKAVALALPNVVYREDIALYAGRRIPAPLPESYYVSTHCKRYPTLEMESIIATAQKAMKEYLRRGRRVAAHTNFRDSEAGARRDQPEYEFGVEYEVGCKHCKQGLE